MAVFFIAGANLCHADEKSMGIHLSHVEWPWPFVEDAVLIPFSNDLGCQIGRYDVFLDNPNYDVINGLLAGFDSQTEFIFTIYSKNPLPSSLPADLDQYAASITNLVTLYKNRVKYWQIENEIYAAPNVFWSGTKEEYALMQQRAYNAIKAADPEAVVLIAGIALGDLTALPESHPFLDYTLTNCLFDKVDLHLYYTYQAIDQRITWLKNQMSKNGVAGKPIWINELGGVDFREYGIPYWSGSPPSLPISPEEEMKQQAAQVVKRFVIVFGHGVEKAFWHKAYTKTTDDFWSHMALAAKTTAGDVKRPAYYTYKILSAKIRNFSSAEKISEGIYKFIVNGRPIFILWNDAGNSSIDMSSVISTQESKMAFIIASLDGSNNPILPAETIVSTNAIPVNEIPVFVEPQPAATFTPTLTSTPTPGITPTYSLPANGPSLCAYPNPAKHAVRFISAQPWSKLMKIQIFNSAGECIVQLTETSPQEHSIVTWDCQASAAGIYIALLWVDGEKKDRIKFAVIK
jgi:hypothetical protein